MKDLLPVFGLIAIACTFGAKCFIDHLPKYDAYRQLLKKRPAHLQEVLRESFRAQQKFVGDLAKLNMIVYGLGFAHEIAGYEVPVGLDIYACFYIVLTLSLWALITIQPHLIKTVFR